MPCISLSSLDLDDDDLADWPALEGVEEIVRWYLSFGYAPGQRQEDMGEEEDKARKTLDGVKVLDLSHNRLAGKQQPKKATSDFGLSSAGKTPSSL